MKTHFKIAALALSAATLTAAVAPQISFAHNEKAHHKGGHQDQHVTVTVDDSGYHPAMVNVKGGREVHMTFISKGDSCANGVRIPALNKSIDLKRGQKKEIVFTPKKGQSIAFACSMKMFKGKITAK